MLTVFVGGGPVSAGLCSTGKVKVTDGAASVGGDDETQGASG